MAAFPSSTPSPAPTFQSSHGGEGTPAELLEFLRTLLAENLDQGPPIPASNKDSWITLIGQLSGHFLSTFPSPRFGPWNVLHEQIKLAEATLEVIERATVRVDSLFQGPDDQSRSILIELIKFLCQLNSWTELGDSEDGETLSSEGLHRKALDTTVVILRCVRGDNLINAQTNLSSWQFFRIFVEQCLIIIRGEFTCTWSL